MCHSFVVTSHSAGKGQVHNSIHQPIPWLQAHIHTALCCCAQRRLVALLLAVKEHISHISLLTAHTLGPLEVCFTVEEGVLVALLWELLAAIVVLLCGL
jgi:hypothetical protein